MKSKLKISCWNTEWASPKSKRGRFFRDKFDSDVICVTEGYEALLPDNGYVISSDEDYGYKTIKGRRKVKLAYFNHDTAHSKQAEDFVKKYAQQKTDRG